MIDYAAANEWEFLLHNFFLNSRGTKFHEKIFSSSFLVQERKENQDNGKREIWSRYQVNPRVL